VTTTAPQLQPLTPRQREIFDWIVNFHRERRIAPTFREIANAFKFCSPNGAVVHVVPLIRKGWLVRETMTARSILPTLEALAHEDA